MMFTASFPLCLRPIRQVDSWDDQTTRPPRRLTAGLLWIRVATKTMMTRKITIMALIAGIVLGGAATEGFNVYRQSHDSQIFQERLRCKAVADAYVKENSTDFKEDPTAQSGVTVTLDKVDYSPARNSCVAELETAYIPSPLAFKSVQDLLSGETLTSAQCDDVCEMMGSPFIDSVFDYAMNNASKPIELIKAEALREPWKSPPKSAPTSGDKDKWDKFQIDPATGERVQAQKAVPTSKYPPKSAPPSGR